MIIVESKRKKAATILKNYPDAILADVTSGAKDGLVKLSPFYPHGGIPVPFSEPSLQGPCDRSLKSEVPCGSCLNWR